MLAAYLKYKAGLTPRKKTQTIAKVNKAQGTFNAMDAVERKIETLDIQALSAEEKQNFIIAIGNMKRTLEAVLAAATEEKPSKNLA